MNECENCWEEKGVQWHVGRYLCVKCFDEIVFGEN